ncbi:MAG: hypothetical protein GX639_10605 [Fibrobacter sp.]|nr:hypothetical protein [Fibrobacter sp.]
MKREQMNHNKNEHLLKTIFSKSILVCIIAFSAVFAQDSTESKISLGVLKLETAGMSVKSSLALSASLRNALLSTNLYKVYNHTKIQALLTQTKQELSLECFSPECVMELGERLGLDKIIFGCVDKNREYHEIILTMVDIKSKRVEKSSNIKKSVASITTDSLLRLTVMRMHNMDTLKTKSVPADPETHNAKKLFYTSGLCMGLGLLLAAVDGGLFDLNLSKQFDTFSLSDISSSIFQLPFFARPAALGDGYIAGSNDAYGVLYNPAGTAWAKGPEVALGYQYGYSMLNNFSVSYVDKAAKKVGFGQCLLYSADVDNLQRDIYFISALSYKFTRLYPLPWPASIGVSVKLGTTNSPESENATASQKTFCGGLDFGLFMPINDNISFAAVLNDAPGLRKVNNTTTEIRYLEYEPIRFNLGGTFQTGHTDYNTFIIYQGQIPLYDDQHWHLSGGIEQELFRVIKLRLGLKKIAYADSPWLITGGFSLKVNTESIAAKYLILDGSYQYNTLVVFPSLNISFRVGF